jgi:hypothetical protein
VLLVLLVLLVLKAHAAPAASRGRMRRRPPAQGRAPPRPSHLIASSETWWLAAPRTELSDAGREGSAEPGRLDPADAAVEGSGLAGADSAAAAAAPLWPALSPLRASSLSTDLKRSSTMVRCWSVRRPSSARAPARRRRRGGEGAGRW